MSSPVRLERDGVHLGAIDHGGDGTPIVRAGDGPIPVAEVEAMERLAGDACRVEIPGARHDLHLHRPEEWIEALSRFLERPVRR